MANTLYYAAEARDSGAADSAEGRKTGLTPTWSLLKRLPDLVSLSPSLAPVTEVGGGVYRVAYDPVANGEAVGQLDFGSTLAKGLDRYKTVALSADGATLGRLAAMIENVSGSDRWAAAALFQALAGDPAAYPLASAGGYLSNMGRVPMTAKVVSASGRNLVLAPTGTTVFGTLANLYSGADVPRVIQFLSGPLANECALVSSYSPPGGGSSNASFVVKTAPAAAPAADVPVLIL